MAASEVVEVLNRWWCTNKYRHVLGACLSGLHCASTFGAWEGSRANGYPGKHAKGPRMVAFRRRVRYLTLVPIAYRHYRTHPYLFFFPPTAPSIHPQKPGQARQEGGATGPSGRSSRWMF